MTDDGGRGGPPLALAAMAVLVVALMFAAIAALLLTGDGAGRGTGAAPTGPATPPTSGEAARQTARQAISALGARSIQVIEPQAPYRPAESPTLFSTPRLVLQAVLPDDPDGGEFVIYEFATAAAAREAGREYADYIASGVGRVQFQNDARFVLRQVGPTLLFFTWSPANATDERTPDVADALATLGDPVPIAP